MIWIGLYVGIQVALRDSARRGISGDQLMNVALLAAVLGIAGGRLYYVVHNGPLFLLMWNLRTRIPPEGMLAMLYIVLYSVSQFFIFFVRDNVVVLGGLKQAQVTSLVVIALTLPVIAYLLRKERLARPSETKPAETPSTAGEVAT